MQLDEVIFLKEEEFIDEKGDKIIIKKIRNKDGKITEER